ncbi:hypothetical protein [Microbacterium pumilum]|uniref:AAA family ATPase n=1 Tax=Microbacterium pumilum TaxID=344165 RepID=A0ABN2S0R1_9MICO
MHPPAVSVIEQIHAVVLAAEVPGIRLVGVDGPGGSGKSTIARELSDAFGWPIVEIDDFLSWVSLDRWWPRFESEVIAPLLAGRSIRYQVRDWAGDEFGEGLGGWKGLAWSPIVIIEGIGSTRTAVAGSLACRVWVDAPPSDRLERGLVRDGESHRDLWERYMADETRFFAADHTVDRADVRIDTGRR